jgi:hypothetical protein
MRPPAKGQVACDDVQIVEVLVDTMRDFAEGLSPTEPQFPVCAIQNLVPVDARVELICEVLHGGTDIMQLAWVRLGYRRLHPLKPFLLIGTTLSGGEDNASLQRLTAEFACNCVGRVLVATIRVEAWHLTACYGLSDATARGKRQLIHRFRFCKAETSDILWGIIGLVMPKCQWDGAVLSPSVSRLRLGG